MAFTVPIDIVNRSCQHLGVERVSATEFTTSTTPQGAELCAAYDKLRRAILRRNLWSFATKHVVLYPIDNNSMLFQPGAWSATQTYYPGAVVADSAGALWTSNLNDNLNNPPALGSAVWDHYFGALTVNPWTNPATVGTGTNTQNISMIGYFRGDVVYVMLDTPYTAGQYNVYKSLSNENTDSPQTPDTWSATQIYFKNQVVDFSGTLYISLLNGNINQEPDTQTSWWSAYVQAYAGGTTYNAGDFVTSVGVLYQSRVAANVGHTPASSTTQWMAMGATWAVGTTYNKNQTVTYLGVLYQSTIASNLAHTPGTDSNWTSTVTNRAYGSNKWLQLPTTTTISSLQISYPLSAGPASQTATNNIFLLPAGHLRRCPQDPKMGLIPWLGASVGNVAKDWTYEGGFIISRDIYPIVYRFVADVQNVIAFDDMFCEGFGFELALMCCEKVTQKEGLYDRIAKAYDMFMGEAREIDGIERGATVIPEDDEYISVRR